MPPPYSKPHMSNELMVDAAHSVGHHPIAVFGPQTGYFSPEILHEIDLHGPGLQARGVSFPGTEIYVELGHGVDYAWSATSASADLIDQRVEKLCNTDGSLPTLASKGYMYFGNCRPMYERTDRQLAKPSAVATNPPSVVTIQIERTYPAAPQEVWRLWTTREGIESWWAPDGFTVEVRALDLPNGLE